LIKRIRIPEYQKVALFAFLAIVGFVLNRHLVDLAAQNQLDPQSKHFVDQGYRPGDCNVIQSGKHHCNLEVPVDKQGNPIRSHAFKDAAKLRHDTAALAAGPTGGFTPTQLHTAYKLPCTPGGPVSGACAQPSTFGPNTIAIVDPGGYRGPGTIESNLATYDQQYGLTACTIANGCLKIVNQSGLSQPLPSPNATNWDLEFDLDVQTAHMICQTCKILLVESTNDAEPLNQAVPTAASFHPTSISLSWGGITQPEDNALFQYTGIAVIDSTGDSGSDEAFDYPGTIGEVISAAGSTLTLNADNSWKNETVWSASGGGCSSFPFNAPAWQTSLSKWATAGCSQYKADGDLSADANPNPGVAIYSDGAWQYGGGTSLAAPIIAGAIALTGPIPSNLSGAQYLYQNASSSNLHDITSGSNCTAAATMHCTAAVGFDTPSGLGSFTGLGAFGGQSSSLLGDLNGDSKVNIYDLSAMLAHWGASGGGRAGGDLNGDGTVNITDLSILLSHWTG
jgi:hypothetical protein